VTSVQSDDVYPAHRRFETKSCYVFWPPTKILAEGLLRDTLHNSEIETVSNDCEEDEKGDRGGSLDWWIIGLVDHCSDVKERECLCVSVGTEPLGFIWDGFG